MADVAPFYMVHPPLLGTWFKGLGLGLIVSRTFGNIALVTMVPILTIIAVLLITILFTILTTLNPKP